MIFLAHNTIQRLNYIVHYLDMKMKETSVEIIQLQLLLVQSNNITCRKWGPLGLYPVTMVLKPSYLKFLMFIFITKDKSHA